uniref:Uncharacterized protein n=1 Tax=Amphimedon queenslandica TaxID=400682 RepID=A0A1X7TGJ4_AMPQE
MDEIWEYIFNERLPLHDKKKIERQYIGDMDTVEELMEKGMKSVTWKDAYFNAVFFFSQATTMSEYEDEDCGCVYRHFVPDLYYGMGTFNSDPANTDIYQCFNTDSTYSIHRVARCAHRCPRLTPDRYTHMYPSPADAPRRDCEFYMSLWDAVMSKCSIKFISLDEPEFSIAFPYLLDPSQHSLKQLELDIEFNDHNTYNFDKVDLSPHDAFPTNQQPHNPFPLTNVPLFQSSFHRVQKSLPIFLNESISHSIIEILQHHQELRKLSFSMQYNNAVLQDSQLTQCIADLLLRPDFKELAFETHQIALPVSFNILLQLFRNFFSSPNPVTLSLRLECPDFPPLTDPLIVNHEQESNKSLELTNCTLSPHFSSLLPRNLVLNSLKMLYFESDILSSLASLESIKVKSFSLEHGNFTKETLSAISSLFRIVSAQEWNIIMNVFDDVIDLFTSLISEKIHLLRHFGLMNWDISTLSFFSMIQSIFSSLSPADVPHFELTFNYRLLNDEIVKAIYDLWEKHCKAVKVKKINVLDRRKFGKPSYMSVLLEMAIEVYAESRY